MSNKKSFSLSLTGLSISNEKLEIGNLTISNDSDKDIADVINNNDNRVVHQHHYTGESEAAAAKGELESKKLDLETLVKLAPIGLEFALHFFKVAADSNTLRHQQRLEEMQEADRLEAARHQRIQDAKGGKPMTPEQVMEAIQESNKQLLEKLVSSVRITRNANDPR